MTSATNKTPSFWQNLENEAKAFVTNIYENDIKPLVAKEEAAFKPLIQATEQEIIQYGTPIVLGFMSTAASALTGSQKMSSAVPQLISALGNVGKTIAVSDAQASLQIITGQIKEAASAMSAAVS